MQPEFAEWVSDAASSLFAAVFFMPIIPIATLICLGNLITQFYFDKYWVLNYLARPQVQSPDLAHRMIEEFSLCYVILVAGQVIFDYWLREEISIWSIFLCCFVGLYQLGNINFWVKGYSKKYIENQQKNQCSGDPSPSGLTSQNDFHGNTVYNDARTRFQTEYDRANPLTAIKATQNW